MHKNIGFNLPANPFRFVRVSSNSKTGPIPVSSTAAQSCPVACPMRTDASGGCYAAAGRSAIHWRTLTEGTSATAVDANTLFHNIKGLPKGQLWRHNEAGDLIGDSAGNISVEFLNGIVGANMGRNGFTYTHHSLNAHNVGLVRYANDNGFTVNVSTNNVQHADNVKNDYSDFPVVTLVTESQWNGRKVITTESGHTVVRCPAEYREDIQCNTCGLCAVSTRKGIVGFTPHGVSKGKVIKIAQG